jgi:pentatricopeptide repeat protein
VTDRELQRVPLGDENLHKLRVDSLKKLLEQGKIDVAFSYLEKVKEKGFLPTREVYEMLVSQLLSKEAAEEALSIYFEAKEKGIKVGGTLLPRLLDAAVGSGADMTKEVFEDIRANGTPSRDQFETMIVSLVEEQRGAEAIEIFHEAKKAGVPLQVSDAEIISEMGEEASAATEAYQAIKKHGPPSMEVQKIMLSIYATDDSAEAVPQVEKHLAEMKTFGLEKPDMFVYEQLLVAYGGAGQHDKCIEIFNTIQKEGLTPTVETYNHMIASYGPKKEEALSWLQKMQDAGLKPDEDTYMCLMELEGDASSWEGVRKRFDEIKQNGLKPNQAVFGLLIHYANALNHHAETLKAFEEMRLEGVYPTREMVQDIIAAADQVGGADKVLVLWSQIKQLAVQAAEKAHEMIGIDPAQTEAYTQWLTDSEQRKARGEQPAPRPTFSHTPEKIEEIKAKYEALDQELLELDSESYFGVCDVLVKRGRIWDAIKSFEEMKQDGIMPDPIFYVSMIQWCQAAKLENEALDLQMEMDMMGYTKEDVEAAEEAIKAAAKATEDAKSGRDPTEVMRELMEKVANEKLTKNFAEASNVHGKLQQDRLRKPSLELSPNLTKKFGLESTPASGTAASAASSMKRSRARTSVRTK